MWDTVNKLIMQSNEGDIKKTLFGKQEAHRFGSNELKKYKMRAIKI